MITKDNLLDVLAQISAKDKKRIIENFDKEYIVIWLHIFNIGSYVTIRLTNDFSRYQNVSKDGNAILYAEEVKELLIKNNLI